MGERERLVELALELAKTASERRGRRGQRKRKPRRRGRGARVLKVLAAMIGAAVVIPVVAITLGAFLGPRGYEGLIATPLSVLAAWGLILWLAFGRSATPRTLKGAELSQLPAQVARWFERERPKLPASAEGTLESIATRLDELAAQVEGLDATLPEAGEVRRLIGEELPALVSGYQRLPEPLKRSPLHDGPSPEQRLIAGLATIDDQIARVQRKLAESDLHRLATHQRYLELKYKGDKKLE